jgi:hypothetical protein
MEDLLDDVPGKIAAVAGGISGLFMDFKSADKYGKLWRIGVVFLVIIVVSTVLNLIT